MQNSKSQADNHSPIEPQKPIETTSAQLAQNHMLAVVNPKRLVHSGKKRAYASCFVWDCPSCNKWNIWRTRVLFGIIKTKCQWCFTEIKLDKSNPTEEITRTKNMKSIID